jgi:thioredoxin reductase (NADPH)
MYDIIIVGGGPAGLTAAIYARRAKKDVLLLEALACGGQIVNAHNIENYPAEAHISGAEFATKLYEQVVAFGAEIRYERAVEVKDHGNYKEVVTPYGSYTGKTVILATGFENRKLGVEGEDSLVGRGISYCATCDGNFFRNRTVAVVGGGDNALEDTLYLADLVSKVYLIYRRDSFPGEEETEKLLKERDNVEFVLNSKVTKLIAEKRLTGVEVTDKEGNVRELEISGLFVAVGKIPENQNFASLIDLDEAGYAVASENCKTKVPGLFVAGDNRVKQLRQLVTATADGAVAATEAIKYIASIN